MTLKSMTGYASKEGMLEQDASTYKWTWDIRSVNGKSLDMRLRVPPFLSDLDQPARKCMSGKIARGNIQANLQIETTRNANILSVNQPMLDGILALSKKLSKQHDISPLSMDGLLSLKGLFEIGNGDEAPEDKAGLIEALLKDFDATLDLLITSRQAEGASLLTVLQEIMDEIESLVTSARDAPERAPAAIRKKLDVQMKHVMEGDHGLSEERLYQEALIMATKADIKEEIDRLEAHIVTARDLLEMSEPVGRRLDFLAQEFNREANTVCSKANDVAITNIGLALKASIEQFREQVQNVE